MCSGIVYEQHGPEQTDLGGRRSDRTRGSRTILYPRQKVDTRRQKYVDTPAANVPANPIKDT